jgi:protein-L-isoaspartate(D-aspartate) O-methyltransferase
VSAAGTAKAVAAALALYGWALCAPSGAHGLFEAHAAEDPEALAAQKRSRMADEQLKLRGIRDPLVLQAMRKVPRHLFVEPALAGLAYEDHSLPIGHGQTISQPYVVAFMTEAAMPYVNGKVLEIGTGSGYQAAVLGEIAKDVYTIEIVEPLAEEARKRLEALGYTNVHVRAGDGYAGWPEEAPFDAILVTAAPNEIPPRLVEQLAVGGRMIVPIGSFFQDLYLVRKTPQGIEKEKILPVRFVPMVEGDKKD